MPTVEIVTKSKKGNQWEIANVIFETKKETIEISITPEQANWLIAILSKLSINNIKIFTLQELQENYEAAQLENFELLWDNKPMNTLYKVGLLML